jgi:hypothetical protein
VTQRLEVFQSLWAMTRRPADGIEMPLPQQFALIANAGFAGVDIVFEDHRDDPLASLLDAHQLSCTLSCFPDSIEALKPAVEMASALNARHLNIIGKVFPFGVAEGASIVRGWMALCDQAGLLVTIETHRDCLTTDLHYCLQLMDAVPEIPLCADLSHFVVAREFSWPITAQVQSQIETILDRSNSFQGRIASREQIQLQISFAQHREWYDLFASWWEYGFESWKKRHHQDATLNFLCELGPREYAMTGADGLELSDRWQEALMIKKRVEAIWEKIGTD